MRVLIIALLPVAACLLAGEPLLAGYFTLWLLTVLTPSTLIEAVLVRTKPLSSPFPLAWALLLVNLVLCLFGFLQVIYLMQDGPRPDAAAALVRFLRETPRSSFLICAFFAIGLATAGSLAQRKPTWRDERLGVGFFFLGAYLLTLTILVNDKIGDGTELIGAVTGWGMGLAILSSLFSLGYELTDALERRILGAPELDLLANHLHERLAERGPLQTPRAEERERDAAAGEPEPGERS